MKKQRKIFQNTLNGYFGKSLLTRSECRFLEKILFPNNTKKLKIFNTDFSRLEYFWRKKHWYWELAIFVKLKLFFDNLCKKGQDFELLLYSEIWDNNFENKC